MNIYDNGERLYVFNQSDHKNENVRDCMINHRKMGESTHLEYCLPPLKVFEKNNFQVPAGACDTHAHVVASDMLMYPMVEGRSYTPYPATESPAIGYRH